MPSPIQVALMTFPFFPFITDMNSLAVAYRVSTVVYDSANWPPSIGGGIG